MKIEISEGALHWFKEEVGLEAGKGVKFYPQAYGSSPVQESFSLAFTIDNDWREAAVHTNSGGITFFLEETDLWFFNGHDLYVDYDETKDELEYKYKKP
ncbi:HesB/YadR/YfhF family protein [Bacillus sp. PS06]|uniref:HesB/YadR/YfhF family protein n=1 Tax=Bacillus sp. PS06 TaxID=2764176 RepID=UPI0017875DC0|nr:HesB/YadR/YfhF family protein [Bacillus sp. PS06]MBD8071561.1 HesB/YadR/YfhF family protein [Bacillus sp. PS06]